MSRKKLSEYRRLHGLVGGYVITFDGKACGWTIDLTSPQAWRPGCIAIAENGQQYTAVGGDYQSGAQEWRDVNGGSLPTKEEAQTSSIVYLPRTVSGEELLPKLDPDGNVYVHNPDAEKPDCGPMDYSLSELDKQDIARISELTEELESVKNALSDYHGGLPNDDATEGVRQMAKHIEGLRADLATATATSEERLKCIDELLLKCRNKDNAIFSERDRAQKAEEKCDMLRGVVQRIDELHSGWQVHDCNKTDSDAFMEQIGLLTEQALAHPAKNGLKAEADYCPICHVKLGEPVRHCPHCIPL